MSKEYALAFVWIPRTFGGHSHGPWDGMRCQAVWQQHPERTLNRSFDISLCDVRYDSETLLGSAVCAFIEDTDIPPSWLRAGEVLELRNGLRCLGIGCIKENNNGTEEFSEVRVERKEKYNNRLFRVVRLLEQDLSMAGIQIEYRESDSRSSVYIEIESADLVGAVTHWPGNIFETHLISKQSGQDTALETHDFETDDSLKLYLVGKLLSP